VEGGKRKKVKREKEEGTNTRIFFPHQIKKRKGGGRVKYKGREWRSRGAGLLRAFFEGCPGKRDFNRAFSKMLLGGAEGGLGRGGLDTETGRKNEKPSWGPFGPLAHRKQKMRAKEGGFLKGTRQKSKNPGPTHGPKMEGGTSSRHPKRMKIAPWLVRVFNRKGSGGGGGAGGEGRVKRVI